MDHIFTIRVFRDIIQRSEEYNPPLCLAFVDCEKAFDSVETGVILESLQRCQVGWRYVEVLRNVYHIVIMAIALC